MGLSDLYQIQLFFSVCYVVYIVRKLGKSYRISYGNLGKEHSNTNLIN